MLQAYLRGFLKPKLKHRTTSRIREEMMFSAMEMERRAEQSVVDMNILVSASAPHYDPKKVADKIRSLQDGLATLHRYAAFDMSDQKVVKSKEFEGMVAMYQFLDSKGLLEKIGTDDKLRKMIEEHQEDD